MKTMNNLPHSHDEVPSNLILRPVGVIKNKIKEPFLAAGKKGIKMQRQFDAVKEEFRSMQRQISKILIRKEMTDILDGIEKYSHLLVLYWAHKVPEQSRSLTKVHPMGRKEFPLIGIFCTCSPARPNPVLTTVVQLRGRKENVLEVTGLDAVNGSPVIDIKPYIKDFYPQKEVLIPEWMQQIQKDIK